MSLILNDENFMRIWPHIIMKLVSEPMPVKPTLDESNHGLNPHNIAQMLLDFLALGHSQHSPALGDSFVFADYAHFAEGSEN